MRLHIIIDDGGSEGLNISSPPVSSPVSDNQESGEKPATPPPPTRKRLREGHMKSAALGRKRARAKREMTGPQEDFEDIANAVSQSVDALPFTPGWMKRKRA